MAGSVTVPRPTWMRCASGDRASRHLRERPRFSPLLSWNGGYHAEMPVANDAESPDRLTVLATRKFLGYSRRHPFVMLPMTTPSDHELALQVYDCVLANCSQHIAKDLSYPKNDPQPFQKAGSDIMKLRILPRSKAPQNFWSPSWCFYELGIGYYPASDGEGLSPGSIQFLQFSNNKQCGEGRYAGAVDNILTALQRERPEFVLRRAGQAGQSHISLGRRYSIKDHPKLPVEVAAKDLAWLIKESLPRFQAIAHGATTQR